MLGERGAKVNRGVQEIPVKTLNLKTRNLEPETLKHIHIVSFDVPFPPSYGGVIDVFFKAKALSDAGVKVHLHCFQYGRREAEELKRFCESVNYYPRKTKPKFLFNSLPYIVVSRQSDELIADLAKDNYPILFEGLHCCYYLADKRLKGRKLFVRTHNIEHDYYLSLAKVEPSFLRRLYFKSEARKLKKFEQRVREATNVLAISPKDAEELSQRYDNVVLLPAFHGYEKVRITEGKGAFALYHGNLEVGENKEAALYLVNNVFNDLDVPLIIAGKNPSRELTEAAAKHSNITIKSNIPTHEIHALIRDAQVNVLPTFQATGIKLKLLAALYNGRHCLVNTPMIQDTGLEQLCVVADEAVAMKEKLKQLMNKPFTKADIEKREQVLKKNFSDKENVKKLIALL